MARRSPPPADADVELDLVDENHHAYMSSSAPSTSSQAPMSSGIGATTTLPPGVASLARQGTQPSYALTLDTNAGEHGLYGSMMNSLGGCCGFFGSIPLCFCCPNPYKRVPQGYVGLVTQFGKFYKCVDPGLIAVNPLTEEILRVDVKIQIAEIPRQVIMTKDNVNLMIDSVLYWHIIDPYQATFGISDVVKALTERTQTTLRHILGARVLQDCIENRDAISHEIQEVIGPAARLWGVKIESILIKDIQFSKELQESLSSAAQAKRLGESKIIAARAEVDSAKLMREASNFLNNPAAMQIRYLETLASMSKTSNTKVIFLPSSGSDSASIGQSVLPQ